MTGPRDDAVVHVAETHSAVTVLGPGSRFVVWVQGCGIGCRECVSPQWISFTGGRSLPVARLAARVVSEAVDGLTLSGGEPFAQAASLADLIERVRAERDLSVLSYSGYTFEHLRAHGTLEQHRLLDQLDILVDGPFLPHRQGSLLWRGSANQRIHLLTDRHVDVVDHLDRSVGLQFEVGIDRSVRWVGVPPVPQFRQRLERELGLHPIDPPTQENPP
jgi:anaerobic ribonucleoside-triphosphate reductase activating protein